jgi:polyvinyl alcohol dehydrogenase (cytochrome)
MKRQWLGALAGLGLLGLAGATLAQPVATTSTPGEALYQGHCAACHDHPVETRALAKDVLAQMPPERIESALTEGKMKPMAAGLSATDRAAIIGYLTGKSMAAATPKADWAAGMMCPADRRAVDLSGPAPITGFGFDHHHTRTLTAKQAGLTKAGLSNLELAWSIAIPGATAMRAQPAVVGKTVFLPVADDSTVYAFDVSQQAKPCIKWLYKANKGAPLRTSAAYGVLADGKGVLAFAGSDTTVYLLDTRTGAPIWTKKVGSYSNSINTGTPVVLKDRVIVPVSQYEIMVGGANSAVCCNNHGYVLSLSPKDGAQQWRYDTMEEAKPVKDRGDGKMLYGPSGAPIWNSPAIDEKRRLIYFGTGESNSPPVSLNTDAIIAIGLDDGKQHWSYQATGRDIFVSGCGPHPKPTQLNCVSDTVYRDVDFGASMILGQAKPGQAAVFGGQKSGAVWAMDPNTGKVIWRQPLGTGSPLGGVHWGIAYDGATVYAPISLVGQKLPDETVDVTTIKSGMYALDPATGAVKWLFATAPDCAGDRQKRVPSCGRMYGFSTAPAIIDGAVVEGGLDGYLYVLDAHDGKQLWKYDTATAYQATNGVAGKGGSIDAASITVANGLLLVNSGYGMFGETPGNMILAFKPKAK